MRSRISLLLAGLACTSAALADSQAPSAPHNVQTSVLSASSVRVSWDRPWDDTGVDGYNVYRDGNYLVTVNDTNFSDNAAQAGQQYRYSVVAFDAARNFSPYSAEASASTGNAAPSITAVSAPGLPATPTGLSSQNLGDGSVQISWNASSGTVDGYNVYRDNSYITTVRGSTNFTDNGVSAGRSYFYEIVAFSDNNQYSQKSAALTVNSGANSGSVPSNDGSNPVSASNSNGFAPAGYTQVFSEEFQGNTIDQSKWNTSYRWGPNWIINQEQQYYVDTNNNPNFGHSPFEFDGEHLTINAIRTPGHLWGSANSQPWLSGTLTTFGKFKMRYGYVEMRARLPGGQGLWPAFWLLNQHDHDRQPEIDVVEMVGRDPHTVYHTYHYYENWVLRSTPSFPVTGPDYSADFHTYGMRWEPGRITWYVDGRETHRLDDGNVSWEEMYLIVNLAVGGVWNGNADGSTPSPARFTIDYIRAFTP